MAKHNKRKSWLDHIPPVSYIIFIATTLVSLFVFPGFKGLLGGGNPLALILTLAPLVGLLGLGAFRLRDDQKRAIRIALAFTTMVGYWYGTGTVFGDAPEAETNIELAAVGMQLFFFILVAPMAIFTDMLGIKLAHPASSLNAARSWERKIRDYIFPNINELHYATLFWCTLLMISVVPEWRMALFSGDLRFMALFGIALYLFIRSLSNKKFGKDTKSMVVSMHYSLLSFLTIMSIIHQIETKSFANGVWNNILFLFTVAVLIFSILRFFMVIGIAKAGQKRNIRFITERFSDFQHAWPNFLFVFSTSFLILTILYEVYDSNETVLLLTYAYTIAAYNLVMKRAPMIVLELKSRFRRKAQS